MSEPLDREEIRRRIAVLQLRGGDEALPQAASLAVIHDLQERFPGLAGQILRHTTEIIEEIKPDLVPGRQEGTIELTENELLGIMARAALYGMAQGVLAVGGVMLEQQPEIRQQLALEDSTAQPSPTDPTAA